MAGMWTLPRGHSISMFNLSGLFLCVTLGKVRQVLVLDLQRYHSTKEQRSVECSFYFHMQQRKVRATQISRSQWRSVGSSCPRTCRPHASTWHMEIVPTRYHYLCQIKVQLNHSLFPTILPPSPTPNLSVPHQSSWLPLSVSVEIKQDLVSTQGLPEHRYNL